MKVLYDKEAQAVYIKLVARDLAFGEIDHSVELNDNILIDKTKFGEIVGIDILGVETISIREE